MFVVGSTEALVGHQEMTVDDLNFVEVFLFFLLELVVRVLYLLVIHAQFFQFLKYSVIKTIFSSFLFISLGCGQLNLLFRRDHIGQLLD